MRGRFITFEGIDGSGKSTQIESVAQALGAAGVPLVRTREPGGTAMAEALRDVILHQPMSALAETLLMFAARAEHVAQVIGPALAAGRWVLCDRFSDATYAYQCAGRGVASGRVATLESWTHPGLQPDLTIVFDLDPAEAARRRAAARAADRFESETAEFFERVRAGYLQRAAGDPQRFMTVDGGLEAGEILRRILERLAPWHD